MKKLFVLLTLVSIMISGCGGGAKKSLATYSSDTMLGFKLTRYHLPNDVRVEIMSDAKDSALISSGDHQELGAFVYERTFTINKSRDLNNLRTEYDRIYQVLKNHFHNLSNITSREGTGSRGAYISADYKLSISTPTEPILLAKQILDTIATSSEQTNAIADNTAPKARSFKVTLQVSEYFPPDSDQVALMYVATAVAEDVADQFENQVTNIINLGNITRIEPTMRSTRDLFVQQQNNNKTDFLFVIDDSPSMSNDQKAVSAAGVDFSNVMRSSQIDYNIAIITTSEGAEPDDPCRSYELDECYDRVLKDTGIIHNNLPLFQDKIIVGDDASATETGIFNAEQALQSIYWGDSYNGILMDYNFPTSGASLSVVIISDEKSQYKKRADKEFDPYNNLFIQRGVKVYAIIKPDRKYVNGSSSEYDPDQETQYDELALATGGMLANIQDKDENGNLDFSDIMEKIARDAGGLASSFSPSKEMIINHNTIVKINGYTIPQSNDNGWGYIQSSNSIVFYGDAVPRAGDEVTVDYEYDEI